MVKIPQPTSPLQSTSAIVDETGRPTPYFLRQWLAQRGINATSEEIIELLGVLEAQVGANTTNITNLLARILTAGVGLNGGGDLSADRTFNLADTAVTPATYGDATNSPQLTIDQQGRVTAAANIPISGGGGGGGPTWLWPAGVSDSSVNTASDPFKGVALQFYEDVEFTALGCLFRSVSGEVYRAGIYRLIGGTGEIDEVTGVSADFTETVTNTRAQRRLDFPSPVTCVAGTRYAFLFGRTDGGINDILRISFVNLGGTNAYPTLPQDYFANGVTNVKSIVGSPTNDPDVGTVLNIIGTGIIYGIGLRYQVL